MSNTQALPEAVEKRIQAAAILVDGYRNADQIRDGLVALGVKAEDDLNEEWCSKGDLLHVVGFDDQTKPTPKVPAHKAVAALYGSQKAATAASTARAEELKAAGFKVEGKDASTETLLKLYRPDLAEDKVTRILKERLGSKKVILFVPGTNEVDTEATINYVADLEQNFPEQEFVMTSGGLARPVAVGEKADKVVDEDPFRAGTPLRKDRSTVGIPVNWAGIPKNVRQLARIIVDRGDMDINSRLDVNSFIALASKGFDAVVEVYPEASVTYREREQMEDLPTLRIMLNGNGKSNDPFNVGSRKRTY